MIGRTFSHYTIVERLGAGSMGEVYRARDLHLDRDVAIKLLPPGTLTDEAARRRFRREAEALSRLNHPHIATVHDFDTDGTIDFLVMELVPGRTLSEHIGRAPLQEREITVLGSQVAAALEEAHERGVVHRDLKPANVMVTPKGQAKVLDFGIAELAHLDDAGQTMTQTSSEMAGTLPYMAPEQLRGEPVDARTDVYALGVVLFEMTTGKRPFDEPHTGRLADAILHAPVTPPSRWHPKVSSELERIILKSLERDPENRYQSAKEIAVDLRRLGTPTTTQPAAVPVRPGSPKKTMAIAAAVGALAIAVALTSWITTRGERTVPTAATADTVQSVVALPTTVDSDASDKFLTDAIPNTISAHLTQIKGLETKVPPASVEVDRVRGDLGRLAEAYGVSAFVLSSLTARSNRLHLNVQLVDARSRRLLWSREFEGSRDGYLALARGAAEELRSAVRPNAAAITPRAGTPNSEAELAYQRGMHYFNRYNNQHAKADFDLALEAFQRTLTLDPKMADAAAGIAFLYEFAIESGAPVATTLPEVRRWGRRAVDIDDRCGRGWCALAVAEWLDPAPRPREALDFGLRASARAPRDAFSLNGIAQGLWGYSMTLARVGSLEAARLDPLYLYPPLNVSELMAYQGRPADALARAEGVLRLEPGMPLAVVRKALALIDLGRHADAAALLPEAKRIAAEGRVDSQYVSLIQDGLALLAGSPAAKTAALERLAAWSLTPGPFTEYPPAWIWLLRHGRTTQVLDILERRSALGRVPYDFLRLRPELKALAGDGRYAQVLATARAQFEDMVGLLKQAEARGDLPDVLVQPLSDLLRTLGITGVPAARASLLP